MIDYNYLKNYIKGSETNKPVPCIWNFFPSFAGALGEVPNFLEYYFDVDVKFQLQTKLKQLLPEALILPGIFPDFGVIVEASAFGGQIRWFKNGAPHIAECIYDIKQIDGLKVPEAGLTGLMPLVLTQRENMRKKLKAEGKEMEKWGFAMGPAEIAGLIMGYQNFYMAFYEDPKRVKTLLAITTEMVIQWLKLQEEEFGGLDAMCIADHVCSQVPPELLNEYILPCEQAIFAEFPNTVKIYHNEVFHNEEHIEQILKFGADIWHFGSDVHNIADLYPHVNNEIVLFGGLNPHGVIAHGTPEQVKAETSKVIEAANNRKLLLSTGTGTTPETSLENQRAMILTTV